MHMDAIGIRLALGRSPALTLPRLQALFAAACLEQSMGLQALYEQSAATRAALATVEPARIASDRAWLQRDNVELVDFTGALYPPQLAQIPDAPPLLYVKGDVVALAEPQLAMVGTRKPTLSGQRSAHDLAASLSRAGLIITSGLALGIDAASHEGALASGARTIAVLATGLDQVYPPRHRALAARIAARGALLTEFPPASPPLKRNFPLRNRIISGLSLGLLVVEAAKRSGSLITARLAGDQGREVFAIPGSINNPMARGCHALIRTGAKLVECAADVLEELKFTVPKQMLMNLTTAPSQARLALGALDKDYKILLDAFGFESASIDVLVARTGFPCQSVASMLLILELDGAVGVQAGGQFVRL